MSEDKIQVKIEADASDFQSALNAALNGMTNMLKEIKDEFASLADVVKTSMQEAADASQEAAENIASDMKESSEQTAQELENLSRSIEDLNSDMDNASSTQSFVSSVEEAMQAAIALAASIFSINTAFDLFKSGIAFNAQMEQAAISFETMLGSADKANQMIGDLQKMAASTPFEFPDLQDGAKRMLAFGFSAESVIPTLTAVGDAAAGLGMSGSEGINRIVTALGQIQAKGKVSGEEMMQMTEAGIPAWDILAKSIGKTTAEVMKMGEQGVIPADKAIQALVAGMAERFPHMMEKQSKSFVGMLSTIRDNFNAVIGDIVKPGFEELTSDVLPNVVDTLDNFSQVMKKSGTAAAFKTILPEGVVDATVAASKAIGEGFALIRQHASLLTGGIVGLTTAFGVYRGIAIASSIATAAQAIAFSLQTGAVALAARGTAAFTLANIAATASAIAATVATEGLAAGFTALAAAMNINPIILAITLSIAALATCVYLVYDNWDEFKGWCIGFWNGIVDLIADNIGLVIAMFPGLAMAIYLVSEYWDDGVALITEIWNSFTGFFAAVGDVIGRIFDDVCTAFDKFADGAKEGISKFAAALADLASNFVPDWAKSLWNQIVGLASSLAAKTAEIGNTIRNNLKISGGGDDASVGDFRRNEYENTGEEPKLPKFEPIDWSGIAQPSGGSKGGSAAKTGSAGKSEYEKAKKLYDQQLRLAEYTATEKEALYKKYLESIEKSDQEAMDYRVGLYQVEKGALAEMLKGQETELQNSKTRGLIGEQQYIAELAALKKKNLDAETAHRAKAMMEAENLTEQEKTAQLAAYKKKVQATVWYKDALKEVLNAEKTLVDFQKSTDKSIADMRKQLVLDAIATEEERLNTLHERNLITQEELIASLKAYEAQRYELEKGSLEQSLETCAANADKMKEAYLAYVAARDQATREMVAREMIANGKSADEVIRILKELDQLKAQFAKKENELDKTLQDEKLQRIKEIQSTMKDSMSQAFQDVLTKTTTFSKALKNIFSTTMKTILKQFTDTIAQTITTKAFKNLLDGLTGNKNDNNDQKKGKKPVDQTKISSEKAIQAQLTAVNAQGNAQRVAQDQASSQQQIATTQTKAEVQVQTETIKDTTITASAQAAGAASVASIESAITAMIQMLPMLILMSVLTGLFGGGSKNETSESTGPGVNLGRNPDSYYKTPTLTGIPSFDVGSWRLPADTLAMVHQDEMIVPAKGGLANGVRDMLTNGGGQSGGNLTANLSYSAAHYGRTNRDVQSEMRQNSKYLVKMIHSEWRKFNREGK